MPALHVCSMPRSRCRVWGMSVATPARNTHRMNAPSKRMHSSRFCAITCQSASLRSSPDGWYHPSDACQGACGLSLSAEGRHFLGSDSLTYNGWFSTTTSLAIHEDAAVWLARNQPRCVAGPTPPRRGNCLDPRRDALMGTTRLPPRGHAFRGSRTQLRRCEESSGRRDASPGFA